MKAAIILGLLVAVYVGILTRDGALAEEDTVAFAVVSEPPKDKRRVAAKIVIEGTVSDTKLLASDQISSNLIWKKLEICHAMKVEGQKSSDGFHVTSVRMIDGSMLPMMLQGFAGDCLLKKALEVAPLVD